MLNKTQLTFCLILFNIISLTIFCQNFLDTIKFGTKEKKLAEIKNIQRLSQKDAETVFNILIEEQDFDICTELIHNLPDNLPVETVLPRILKLLSSQQVQQYQKLVDVIRNYITKNRNNEYTYSYIRELILSETTNLQLKSYLVRYLNIFPYEKVLPIIKQIYNTQDVVRFSIATLLASYSDKQTKEILLNYLSDEIPDVVEESVRSLIQRKEWDVLPLILPLTQHKFCGEKIRQMLNEIDDPTADRFFFMSIPLFEEKSLRKLCLILSAKHKNVEFLPLYLELYKSETRIELKRTLYDIIQSYAIRSAEHVLVAHLNNKQLYDVIIPVLIKIQSNFAIPYMLDVYPQLPAELQIEIENFLTTTTTPDLIYHLLSRTKTKSLPLRCLVIKMLSSFDNPLVYSYLRQEISSTKNKKILSAMISSINKVPSWEEKIVFIKLLITKCSSDISLLVDLLIEIEKIVKISQEKNIAVLLPDLVNLLKHPQKHVSDKSFEIIQVVIKKCKLNDIQVVYDLIPSLPDETKLSIIKLFSHIPDYKFLPVLTNIYYKTKNVQLKQTICEYIFNLTGSVSNQVIVDSLQSGNQELQLYVLNLIRGKIVYPDLQFLLPLCNSKNKLVKQTVVTLISELLTEKERNYILNFLNDDNPEIKITGIKIAAKVLPKEFLTSLSKLLLSPQESVRKTTLEQILKMSPTELVIGNIKPMIINIAKNDKSLDVRATAVLVLAHWKECDTEVVKIYFDAISSHDTKLRSAAEYAFSQILPSCQTAEDIFIKGLITDTTRNFFVKKAAELKPRSEKVKHTIKTLAMTAKDTEKQKIYLTLLSELLEPNDTSILIEFYETENFVFKLWAVENITKFSLDGTIENLILTALKEQQASLRQKAVEVAQKFLNSKKIYNAIVYISTNDTNYSIRSLATRIVKEAQNKK